MHLRLLLRVGPISLGIAPHACTILSKFFLLLLLLLLHSLGIAPRACTILSKLLILLLLLLSCVCASSCRKLLLHM
jgi:hypothetical protein